MGLLEWFKGKKDEGPAAITRALRAELQRCDHAQLVVLTALLRAPSTYVHGKPYPVDAPGRADAAEEGMARIRELVATLPVAELHGLLAKVSAAQLPIDRSARANELEAARTARIESARIDEPRNPALEAAVLANEPNASTVLADWLTDRGHPRGELIALQLRGEDDPEASAAALAHLEAHADVLLGPLADYRQTRDDEPQPAIAWRRGFIEGLVLSCDADHSSDTTPLADVLELVLAHPSGRWLSTIRIGINIDPATHYEDLVAGLVAHPPPQLRELYLGDIPPDRAEISWISLGSVAALWTLPSLRKLVVRGGAFSLGTIAHASLEHLEIETGGLSIDNVDAITAATLPALRHLDLWYGDPGYGAEATPAHARALLARNDLPALAHLGLMNCAFVDDIFALVFGLPVPAQLIELDLSLGTMTDVGARALAGLRGSFPKLERLDVSDNYLSDRGLAALRAAFPEVVSTRQRTGEPRYVSVGE